MNNQVTQIPASSPSLFGDTSAAKPSDDTFQQFLDEEQKRFGLMFSPFNMMDFSGWFDYPNGTKTNNQDTTNHFSTLEPQLKQNNNYKTEQISFSQSNPTQQIINQGNNDFGSKTVQTMLQEILTKTGWLTPNLSAQPMFFTAQAEGKLLSKLDLQLLVDQILAQVKLVKARGKVELTMGFKPDNLEELLLTLTSRSGMISIKIEAPEETKKLISAQLKELELALRAAKINLDEIQVVATKEVAKHV